MLDCVGKKQRVPGAVAGHTDDKEHVVVGHFGTVQCTVDLGTTVHNSLVQYTKHTLAHFGTVHLGTVHNTPVHFGRLQHSGPVYCTALRCIYIHTWFKPLWNRTNVSCTNAQCATL